MNNCDITGMQFGNLTVVERDKSSIGERNSKWFCKCACGNIKSIARCSLVTGHTKSCGCTAYTDKNKTHGKSKTRIYHTWVSMKNRCSDPSGRFAKHYFQKGIRVCDEWKNDFMSFYKWSMKNGYNDSMTIDRIDNSIGYNPSNCRWVSNREQQANKTNTIHVTYNGKDYCLRTLCESIGFPYKTAHNRYRKMKKRGVPINTDKLLAPVQEKYIPFRYRKNQK